jgi:hypothetical protein
MALPRRSGMVLYFFTTRFADEVTKYFAKALFLSRPGNPFANCAPSLAYARARGCAYDVRDN